MSRPGFAGNSYLLDINADSGAFVNVVAKSTVRRLVIEESQITAEGAPNTPQGVIDYQLPNDGTPDGFTTVFRATQGETLPIELGSTVGQRMYQGEVIGQLGQPIVGANPPGLTNATVMIKLRSGSDTATTVQITEYN